MKKSITAEEQRLLASNERTGNWQRWGPYLSERQWGTVREDYSESGDSWQYFPHDHARSRAYRWGEDGLMGITDRQGRLCFALGLWNGRDPILKERLFGLTGPEGNHGEDVKECYYYLDSTPTHSYMRGLYKYPQARYPYEDLAAVNQSRSRNELEYELTDTGVFDEDRYFDVDVRYAKRAPDDILIRVLITNRGPDAAVLHVVPQLWFRNTWTWHCTHEGCTARPHLSLNDDGRIVSRHETLGAFQFAADTGPQGEDPTWLFTDNETNADRHPDLPCESEYYKDAFHQYVIEGDTKAVNPKQHGTKAAPYYLLRMKPGEQVQLQFRLAGNQDIPSGDWFGDAFDASFEERASEADSYYDNVIAKSLSPEERNISRQAYAGLLWTKQFYHFVVDTWLNGDPNGPPAPASRQNIRNKDWRHLFNRDVLSMPDKWEYPWFAAWDSAFHMIPMARLDPHFAKEQLILFLREWYMHPNGQIPAYEWTFSDVNPPVHAWACWSVYEATGEPGERDRLFLARTFQKLLLNFTWWVNRKDPRGRNVFSGGFLGLDNIGVFDRSKPLPDGGYMEQADGTGWMAFYCGTMLRMALELADNNPAYGDMASKFLEHYVAIAEAMNSIDGDGLWDDQDGFYYDHLYIKDHGTPMRIRSIVGLIPLLTPVILDEAVINRLPGFNKRMKWFLDSKPDLRDRMTYAERKDPNSQQPCHRLLAIPSEARLRRLLSIMLDESEFLSPYGIRSLSAAHREDPFVFELHGVRNEVQYVPGESDSWMFGGNSNWRGPVWMPLNFLIIESLRTYYQFCGDTVQLECPTGSGQLMTLLEIAEELERRLTTLFKADDEGHRPIHGGETRYAEDSAWNDLVLFYEYFHGDNGRGLGASHQTGWTSLVATMLDHQAQSTSKRS
ncbi:MGH1-like glycoside hydrolase domain-containing protein [Rosistilla oblonga]|uniref:MGH1-like glycoside hydrolase domain-containing protein n=1 Tax=Rosistilla oblonga TaxID=2527990 RepID=UPI003A9867D1